MKKPSRIKKVEELANLTSFSRAGDVFHYRWAARRCLKLLDLNTNLTSVVIEGSKERTLPGECAIDITEYYRDEPDCLEEVVYFQLKHSVARQHMHFNISDVRETFEGFAARFKDVEGDSRIVNFKFVIVTNRPFNPKVLNCIQAISLGEKGDQRITNTLKRYTSLTNAKLKIFCQKLDILDSEGNYLDQEDTLQYELSRLTTNTDPQQVDSLVSLVHDKATRTGTERVILKEHVLKKFGLMENDIYPAPPKFESDTEQFIIREQYRSLRASILESQNPLIIHANGGVGKTVVARQLANDLPRGSFGLVYDCFGAGNYRNRSTFRHSHETALIQIISELSVKGLCKPIIPSPHNLQSQKLMAKFLQHIEVAITFLRQNTPDAVLLILIDAADNAEMAAKEFGDSCFANELLRENIPEGCRLVMLCRSERMGLLHPKSTIQKIELKPFSEKETLDFLRVTYPEATKEEALEFHKLSSNGNPRVQSYALSKEEKNIHEVLENLGPNPTSIDDQIEAQLTLAVERSKEALSPDYRKQIDLICLGLANLPPLVPLEVLSKASGVDLETIKSFVSDMRQPLRISENFVQFRDEPTEYWFRNRFAANAKQIASFVRHLKPLANDNTYVASALPALLEQAEKYKELIKLALSDDFLPKNNPADERNIKNHRLRFAFKAALKSNKIVDASKIAFMAGEEHAGDLRQQELFNKNIDLVSQLLDPEKIREFALRGEFSGQWKGSENIYSSALLSSVPDFRGEALSYLRSGEGWLKVHFEEYNNNKHEGQLEYEDIVEYAFAILNLFGAEKVSEWLLQWGNDTIFRVGSLFIHRLVDKGDFASIDAISKFGKRNPYFILAISNELSAVEKFPKNEVLNSCLVLLNRKKIEIPNIQSPHAEFNITDSILSFAEACAFHKVPAQKILKVLRYYASEKADLRTGDEFHSLERNLLFRGVALRQTLKGKLDLSAEDIFPKSKSSRGHDYDSDQDYRKFRDCFDILYPWYLIRARSICGEKINLESEFQQLLVKSKDVLGRKYNNDSLKSETPYIQFKALACCRHASTENVKAIVNELIVPITVPNRCLEIAEATRIAYRQGHLSCVRQDLERETRHSLVPRSDERPEDIAEGLVSLARAVLCASKDDANVYFDDAVGIVSKFGDEVVSRWDAVQAMANKTAELGNIHPKLAYRFARCGEVISGFYHDTIDFNAIFECLVKMNVSSAFSILSRWIDRHVAWMDPLIFSVVKSAVSEKQIPPSGAWACTAFLSNDHLVNLTGICCKHQSDKSAIQAYIDWSSRDISLNNEPAVIWVKLKEIADEHNCQNSILTTYAESDFLEDEQFDLEPTEEPDWKKIFQNYDLCTEIGLKSAMDNYREFEKYELNSVFWGKVFEKIPSGKANNFLEMVINQEYINFHTTRIIFKSLPAKWRTKVSVERKWHIYLESLGEKFFQKFSNLYFCREYYQDLLTEKSEKMAVQKGAIQGFKNSKQLFSAKDFFQFSQSASEVVDTREAQQILDYSISRFEIHIESNKSDGEWSKWLVPPSDPLSAFCGFIWTMLGSPHASYRWNAAHCVRRLMVVGSDQAISKLMECLRAPKKLAFVGVNHPFYDLHAKQYLLMALARGSLETPKILKKHFDDFVKIARKDKHLLIQKYSSDVAINLSRAFPSICDQKILEEIKRVTVPKLNTRTVKDRYGFKADSPWHKAGKIFPKDEIYLGLDIGDKWLAPLGDVFRVPQKQIEEIVKDILLKKWKIRFEDKFLKDPRQSIWNSTYYLSSMDYRDGTLAKIDNYSLYLSYHAIMSIASVLIKRMPVIQRENWPNEWEEWLSRHIITGSDGTWLSDRRDGIPPTPIEWYKQEKDEDWRWKVSLENFLNVLVHSKNTESWLIVNGSWCLAHESYAEECWIDSRLISSETADSFLNALIYCRDIQDRYFPQEDRYLGTREVDPKFKLTEWAMHRSEFNGLNDQDPHFGGITDSPIIIKESVVERMKLNETSDQRKWFLPAASNPSVVSELWSEVRKHNDDKPHRKGCRLKASFKFLKSLCEEYEKHLVISVKIHRTPSRLHRGDDDFSNPYLYPYLNFYILSPDGTIRDAKRRRSIR